jgi:hypothetical protein
MITAPIRISVDSIQDCESNYRNMVTNQMDLQMMKEKFTWSEQRSVQEFIDDNKLICNSAQLYNCECTV